MSKAAEKRELKDQLRKLIADGATEYECLEELGLTKLSTLRKLRQNVFADELEEVHGDTPAMSFVRYKLRQEGVIAKLDEIIDKGLEKHSSLNAAVSASKAKANILDNVRKAGQDSGVLPTVAVEPKTAGKDLKELKKDAQKIRDRYESLAAAGSTNYEDDDEVELYFDEEDEEEPEEVTVAAHD